MDPGGIRPKPPISEPLKPPETQKDSQPTKTATGGITGGIGEVPDSIDPPKLSKFDSLIKDANIEKPGNILPEPSEKGILEQRLGGVLDQKINVAEPACSGTLASTCGVPDTDPSFCDTLSGCLKDTRLGGVLDQKINVAGPGPTMAVICTDPSGVLDQKINVAEPACSGTLASTCGVPDTDPSFCDTLSGCQKG